MNLRLQDFSRYAEVRHLAHTMAAQQKEKMFHSLAILSFLRGEGKTLLCASLAMAYAETEQARVLIVDTSTYHHKDSLALKDCLNDSVPLVEVIAESDPSAIKRSAENKGNHSLILLDTCPMEAKNKSNVDPLLVARLADASLLLVSQKFLNSAGLPAALKVLKDPALHLLGMVSNKGPEQ